MELNDPNHRHGYFEVDEIDGWWNPPSWRNTDEARALNHGDMSSESFLEARYITIRGAFAAKARNDRWEGANIIAALLASGARRLVVRADSQILWADVKAVDQASAVWVAPLLMEYTLQLKANDPFRYGEAHSYDLASGSEISVFHFGTTEAWPVVTVMGSMPDGYTLSYRSQTVSVPMGIPSGVTHRIDFKNRRLYVNGEVFFGAFGSTGFRPVPSGPRTAFGLSCPSGSGTAVVSVTDTYI
ncbi:hypothetical protein ACR9WD_05990 [Glutamicibacter sp. PAEs-4]|uniref:hypothetical protein n=1 Tax=Glutamicibacter sp. PAEs-4 TaxID=3444114 RepID=UPI003EB8038C